MTALRHKHNAQVMLIGFDEAEVSQLSDYLSDILIETHVIAHPYDGLAAVIDDPFIWLCCIIDARVFADADEILRFETLFAYEGHGIGMILGHADREMLAQLRSRSACGPDMVADDICSKRTLERALKAVLFRRGYCDQNILVELGAEPTALPRRSGDTEQIA